MFSSAKHPVLTGTAILTCAGILSRLIGFFYRIFLSRTIGAQGLGIYQMIFPVYAFCLSGVSAGIQSALSLSLIHISERYLEQLMASLKKEGLVKSIRGANGGYQLARPAIGISVGDILRALEGDLRAVTCPANGEEGNGGCENADLCVTRYVWQRINEGITHAVDTMYLNQLVEESKKLKEKGQVQPAGCQG